MNALIGWLWRLVPGNPILVRVVEMAGKRQRDFWIRTGYLGILVVFVTFMLFSTGGRSISGAQLGELSKQSSTIFIAMSFLQLGLVALLAPVFTAGAITQEKDSQTYDILLSTPLSNAQIVLGSLLSRLYFVIALLISGIPIFSITQIFGGVSISSIVLSFGIAAATAFVTGALAMAIATFKVGTRKTIFSFYLVIVAYLVGVFLLDRLDFFRPYLPELGESAKTSWLTGMHPFLALRVIFNDPAYVPPDITTLPEGLRSWPIGYYLSQPHLFFINFMFLLSLVLVLPSIVLLRHVAQATSTTRMWLIEKVFSKLPKLFAGLQKRDPRTVWHNPIAWREARTKASATRSTVIRYAFIGSGITATLVLMVLQSASQDVEEFITSSSYDPVDFQLTIYSSTGEPKTALVNSSTIVRINDEPADIADLIGRYEVTYNQQAGQLTRLDATDIPTVLSKEETRDWLLGLALLEVAIILLIVTNAAASTVTREKEDGTLDLLLSTPITSRYYIWGKLRGLVSFVLPLIAVPAVSALIFVVRDFLGSLGSNLAIDWVVFPEAVILVPVTLITVTAVAAMVGMQMSLRSRQTVVAVMSSVAVVVGAAGALAFCSISFLDGSGIGLFRVVVASFSPLTVLALQFNPYDYGGEAYESTRDAMAARVAVIFFSLIACGVYLLIVFGMYKSMVKNFDMTIRRQHR